MKPRKRKKCPECGGNLNIISECPLCEMFARGKTPGGHLPGVWPRVSSALAVHKSQIPAATERNRKHGVGVRYDKNGNAILDSVRDKAALVRLEREYLGKKLCDYDAGYSDA